MIRFVFDFFWFPFAPGHPSNKFGHVLQFIMKDFSLYFWLKPSRRSLIKFPFALLRVIWQKTPSERFSSTVQLLFFFILFSGSVLGYSYRTQQDPRVVMCDYLSLCWIHSVSLSASYGSTNEDGTLNEFANMINEFNHSDGASTFVRGANNEAGYKQPGIWILGRYRDSPVFIFSPEDKVWIQSWWLSGTLATPPSGLLDRVDQTLATIASSDAWTAGIRLRLREDLGRVRDALTVYKSGQSSSGEAIQTGSGYTFFLRSSVFLDPDRSSLSRSTITRLQRTMALLESRGWTPGSVLSEEDRSIVYRLSYPVIHDIVGFIRSLSDEGDERRARYELFLLLTLLHS